MTTIYGACHDCGEEGELALIQDREVCVDCEAQAYLERERETARMDSDETDIRRRALDRERKRLAKEHAMRGYSRQSVGIIAKLVGVKRKGKTNG